MTLRMLAVAASLAAATAALAQSKAEEDFKKGIKGQPGKYGTAGCGLGAMAFKDQPGGIQIIAATLNGLSLNQSFGITFGTSNCGPSLFAQGTRNFVEANREALAKDVARGEGEAVGALTVINACADSRAVGAALQRRFTAIFPSPDATDAQVTEAILATLHADPALGCGRG
jgi:hypothetical protein